MNILQFQVCTFASNGKCAYDRVWKDFSVGGKKRFSFSIQKVRVKETCAAYFLTHNEKYRISTV
jgi:hypothetical protein